MAEKDTDTVPQYMTDVKAGETLSTSLSDEHKQKDPDSDQNTTEERSKDDGKGVEKVKDNTSSPLKPYPQKEEEEIVEQRSDEAETLGHEVKATEPAVPEGTVIPGDSDQPEEEMTPLTGGTKSLVLDSKSNVGKNCGTPQDDDRSHGDNSGESPRNKDPTVKPDEFSKDHSGETKAPETSTGTEEDVGRGVEKVKDNTSSPLKPSPQKEIVKQRSDKAETLRPATEEEATEPAVPEGTVILGGNTKYWILVCIVALSSFLVHHLRRCESPPEKTDVRKVDIFLRELEIVKTRFPNQHPELWRRSKIHLARHLQTAQPTEPVSLILTAGRRAERTLHCLARGLASAFSAALNASVLHIDGASKASQDSDQVKLDIDRQLRAAFEGDKPVAVIHRFEELPPGSTLIFYRYCDHENAAYKKTSLIFTVLLGGEEELHTQLGLSTVEEMVDDQLQNKFLSSGHRIAFDSMDLDKYSGLWSRISHLILPVAAEKRIEHGGC
ncbi:torsin-1A-interacting protein 2-like isoform X2 [Centroberyx gerrardi]